MHLHKQTSHLIPTDPFPRHPREKVKTMLDSFLKEVAVFAEEFFAGAPYSHEGKTSEVALAYVEASKAGLAEFRRKAAELKAGMDIFHIPQPSYKVGGRGKACS